MAVSLRVLEELQSISTLINTLLTQALYQVEVNELDAARTTLARADDLLQGTPDGHLRYQRTMAAAHLAYAERREAEACELLGQAVRLGNFRYLGLLPAAVARLCAVALERDIEADAARTLIRKLQLPPPDSGATEWLWPVKIHSLGRFTVQRDDAPLPGPGKLGRKPLELLKAVIALGGRGISRQQLTDALWPDAEGDSQVTAFETALSRLRKLIGKDAVILNDGLVTLDARTVWVDSWAFDRLLVKLNSAVAEPCEAAEIERLTKRLFALYQGPFLAREPEQSWMLTPSARAAAAVSCAAWSSLDSIGKRRGNGARPSTVICADWKWSPWPNSFTVTPCAVTVN